MDTDARDGGTSLRARLTWFAGLWAAGVLVVGSLAYLLRWWLV